jgi:hypothetical protein
MRISHKGEFTTGNAKTVKGEKKGYLTAILHFLPANGSGINVCPMATPGCIVGCLNKAGRGGVPVPSLGEAIQAARKRRTLEYFADRAAYVAKLSKEFVALKRKAKRLGLTLAVRPNGTSDLPGLAYELATRHPDVQFYDYTKLPRAWQRTLPNYHLTFSRSESNAADVLEALRNGINVAVVFDTRKGQDLPATYLGRPVVDGDETDLRFLDGTGADGKGLVIGLRAKGPAKKDCSGFVVPTLTLHEGFRPHAVYSIADAVREVA